jgi:pyrroline-5-carboxylate reductase
MEQRIAFLGGGNMAEAILGGLLASGLVSKEQILVSDVLERRRSVLAETYGIQAMAENQEAVRHADLVVLAVKPQQAKDALQAAGESWTSSHVVISICAGISTAQLEEWIPARVVRVMPNLPALVRCGVSAVCGGMRAMPKDMEWAEAIFSSVGAVVQVREAQMDAVTGVSGSGPGYVFAFMEALERAAGELGLDAAAARRLVQETVRGAAELAVRSGEDPAVLRSRVSSKGGTTLAGLAAMEAEGFQRAVLAGVHAARDRSAELAKGTS